MKFTLGHMAVILLMLNFGLGQKQISPSDKTNTMEKDPENFLWAATVRIKSFEERFQAAKAGGFTEMSVFPLDIKRWEAQGNTIAELVALADTFDVRITVLDPLTKWLPRWEGPDNMSKDDAEFVDFDMEEFFRMANALKVESITIIETFGQSYTMDELVENASKIADMAEQYGMQVHIEFMPFSGIPDLETAWQIVDKANRENLGIVFDTWHYFRGTVNDSLLATIPGEKIYRVQLADATKELSGKNLFDDLMHHRMFPGEGEFPMRANYMLLKEIGALNSVGVELFSDRADDMKPTEIGTSCRQAIQYLSEN